MCGQNDEKKNGPDRLVIWVPCRKTDDGAYLFPSGWYTVFPWREVFAELNRLRRERERGTRT